jgi:guanylate kinase
LYPYVVVNDRIDSAVATISSIIDAEGVKRSRNGALKARISELDDGIQRAIDHYSPRK